MSQFLVDLQSVIREEMADFTQILAFVLAIRFPTASIIIVAVVFSTIFTMLTAFFVAQQTVFIINFYEIKKYGGLLLFVSSIIILKKAYMEHFISETKHKMIIYAVTVLAFILVELIDKTGQVIFNLVLNNPLSISLFGSIVLGTLIANTPVIFLGTYISSYLPKNINVIFVSVIISLLAFQIIMS